MPVFNGEKYLQKAIQSILDQTLTNFEFLIIDDGSTDSSIEIINQYNDTRIVFLKNIKNLGITKTLNLGINRANGFFIARADADDFYDPTRLEKQINFLKHHKDIDVVGTWCNIINKEEKVLSLFTPPVSHHVILWHLFFMNPLAHPSVMFKKDNITLINGFNEDRIAGQDYELWTRGFFNLRYANIPEFLTNIRKHERNISITKRNIQRDNWYLSSSHLISRMLDKVIDVDLTKDIIDPGEILSDEREFLAINMLISLHSAFIRGFCVDSKEDQEITEHLSSQICSRRRLGSTYRSQIIENIKIIDNFLKWHHNRH